MHGPMGPPGVLPSALTIGCNRLRGQAALQSTKGAASETAHGDLLASRGHPHRVSSRISTARLAWHARYGFIRHARARHAPARHGTRSALHTLGTARSAWHGTLRTARQHDTRHGTSRLARSVRSGTAPAEHGTLDTARSVRHARRHTARLAGWYALHGTDCEVD